MIFLQIMYKNSEFFLKSFVMCAILFAFSSIASAQQKRITVQEYINTYKYAAIDDMRVYGIPASIKLAQGILESAAGNSELALKANNHFGIKCKAGWVGDTMHKDDDEKNECFRKYGNPAESYRDHSEFLKNGKRYSFLFSLEITDYKAWAHGLKSAGYATAPDYASKLIRIIEEHKLYELDSGVSSIAVIANIENPTALPELNFHGNNNPDIDEVVFSGGKRKTYTRNGRAFIIAGSGDTPLSIGKEYQTSPLFIRRFNDLKSADKIVKGQMIFIEPKKGKAETDFHIVKSGETLYQISQFHGIKLKKLYKRNNMKPGENPRPGQKLWLNSMKPL